MEIKARPRGKIRSEERGEGFERTGDIFNHLKFRNGFKNWDFTFYPISFFLLLVPNTLAYKYLQQSETNS